MLGRAIFGEAPENETLAPGNEAHTGYPIAGTRLFLRGQNASFGRLATTRDAAHAWFESQSGL